MQSDEVRVSSDVEQVAADWTAELERRWSSRSFDTIGELFTTDAHWRDMIAFTWRIGQVHGRSAIVQEVTDAQVVARRVELARRLSPPAMVTVYGRRVIQAFIDFETSAGSGTGVVRLELDDEAATGARAWLLFTTLRSLSGLDDPAPSERAARYGFERQSPTEYWPQYRDRVEDFSERDPDVLVVGGSQAGVIAAARLTQLGVDTLVVEKSERLGDAWRHRYNALSLHFPTTASEFPYLPFPSTFPKYMSKDKLADWIEHYARALDIPAWTSTEFLGGRYETADERWEIELITASGARRVMRPRHIVLAIGAFGQTPRIPDLPGLSEFSGTVTHTSVFKSGSDFSDKRVLVVGTGTSAHDVALDLHHHGADVTMLQRGTTTIVTLDTLQKLYFSVYDGDVNLEEIDLLTAANQVFPLVKENMRASTTAAQNEDGDLLRRLNDAGFATDSGIDGTGWQLKAWRYGAGYYIDVGASEYIASGKIHVRQLKDIARFESHGVEMRDGTHVRFDAVILATGFENAEADVARLFGKSFAERVGPIFQMDDLGTGEWRNAWGPTAQPGLWFMVGGLPQVRPNSLSLALQIKAELADVRSVASRA